MTPRILAKISSRRNIALLFLPVLLALPLASASAQSWDYEEALKAEGYITPPEAIAQAILAPWYLNSTLSNPNADKTWFLEEVGSGPMPVATLPSPSTTWEASSSTSRRTETGTSPFGPMRASE